MKRVKKNIGFYRLGNIVLKTIDSETKEQKRPAIELALKITGSGVTLKKLLKVQELTDPEACKVG